MKRSTFLKSVTAFLAAPIILKGEEKEEIKNNKVDKINKTISDRFTIRGEDLIRVLDREKRISKR